MPETAPSDWRRFTGAHLSLRALRAAAARKTFQTSFEGLREKGITRDLEFDGAARVFGLVFAIENLFANLGDFEERVEETVSQKD